MSFDPEFIVCGSQALKPFGNLIPNDTDLLVVKPTLKKIKALHGAEADNRYVYLPNFDKFSQVAFDCQRYESFGIGLDSPMIFSNLDRYTFEDDGVIYIRPEVEYVLETFRQRPQRLDWFKAQLIDKGLLDWSLVGELLSRRHENFQRLRRTKKFIKSIFSRVKSLRYTIKQFRQGRLVSIFPITKRSLPGLIYKLDAGLLIQRQCKGNYFSRPDLVVKYQIFSEVNKVEVQKWIDLYLRLMQRRKGTKFDKRIESNIRAHLSQANHSPIQVASNHALQDGSHRLSGALASKNFTIECIDTGSNASLPNFWPDLYSVLNSDEELQAFYRAEKVFHLRAGSALFFVDWGLSRNISKKIHEEIDSRFGILSKFQFSLEKNKEIFEGIYKSDSLEIWKACLKFNFLLSSNARPTIIFVRPSNFSYRINSNLRLINQDFEEFKKYIRRKYSRQLGGDQVYFPDVLLHSCDGPEEARDVYSLIEKDFVTSV